VKGVDFCTVARTSSGPISIDGVACRKASHENRKHETFLVYELRITAKDPVRAAVEAIG
jgi:hypothetical protein